MEPLEIRFAEWLPDLPALNNPGATEAKNVLPLGKSYKPVPTLSVYSNALSETCRGAFSARDGSGGNATNFAGSATKLYQMTTAAWADVSKVGGYNLATGEKWYFTQYGNRVIATNVNDPMQSFIIGSSSAFANLSASAPQARYIAELRNFIIAGNTYDAVDGNVPYRVRWSAYKDPTDWTVSASTQADYNDLNSSYGWVQQVVGGDYGVVFQEKAITRMDYAGSPLIFQFRPVAGNQGTQTPGSVIRIGNNIYFFGLDGVYVFDGNQCYSIGENKIDNTVFDDLDQSYLWNVSSAVDYTNKIIAWAYPAAGNTAGRCNKILFFNYANNSALRWSYAIVDVEHLYSSLSEGYTLDTLDTLSGSIDTLEFSLDSRVYTGNQLLLSAFDSSHRLNNFTGTPGTAVLDTMEAQITPGQRTYIDLIRPVVDGSGTVTFQVGARNLQSGSVTWGSAVSIDSVGNCQVRSNARFHRGRLNITGDFNHAIGIDVIGYRSVGKR